MHKITKGLKKKKKGKKSKHKEEELFKPEELEAYRREHQDESSAAAAQNEEWKKFLALTSGVDDVLKKTQGDLDRIKSTSFFQRVPPPSEVKKQEQLAETRVNKENEEPDKKETEKSSGADIGIVQVSESESEEEDEDDIFDTAYIDAIASGEVKLAYIPESPTEETTGDDPFDTSIAERAILGPAVERKGKKLVPIGAAVEVLTGRVQIPTCATSRPASSRRQVLKEKDLLLGSFDDNANSIPTAVQGSSSVEAPKTLLDDDTPIPLAEEPIDLSKTLHQIVTPQTPIDTTTSEPTIRENAIVNEFEAISKNVTPDEDDEEFAKLAAESLSKTPVAVVDSIPQNNIAPGQEEHWAAFNEDKSHSPSQDVVTEEDPFDTTFAENILPGKAELKVIENEILKEDNEFDFNPRADDKFSQIINKVSINVTDPAGQRESISSLDRVSEADLNLIKPIHRDLLGGSNTDLSNLSDKPLKPSEQIDENYIEYCDPFDTSIVETAQLPGQTELKFLEKELLGDIQAEEPHLNDDEFNPRGEESKERTLSRPDVLNISTSKTVSFDLPSPQNDLFDGTEEHINKVLKPLTPFYARKSSLPEEFFPDENDLEADPFDTSFVRDIGPGKTELKLIESELFDPATERRLSISDQDFDPRNEEKVKREQVVQSIKEIVHNQNKPVKEEKKQIDLLAVDHDVSVKVLTPSAEKSIDFNNISYTDPFDTSIATNIVPGKTELKLLETELIHSTDQSLVDQDFNPRNFSKTTESVDLLDDVGDAAVSHQPLNPVVGEINSFDSTEDIDPFDTSIANNIVPGKAELKILESELM